MRSILVCPVRGKKTLSGLLIATSWPAISRTSFGLATPTPYRRVAGAFPTLRSADQLQPAASAGGGGGVWDGGGGGGTGGAGVVSCADGGMGCCQSVPDCHPC